MSAGLGVGEALGDLHTYASDFQDLWKFYITVVFAVLGFVVSARSNLDRARGILIALAFAAYAAINLLGLTSIDDQRWGLYAATKEILAKAHVCGAGVPAGCDTEIFSPPDPRALIATHIMFDVVFCGIIIILTWNLRLGPPKAAADPDSAKED